MIRSIPKSGVCVAAVVTLFVSGAIAALLYHSPVSELEGAFWQDPYFRHVTWFSFYQAALSTLLSVGLAIPVSHALARRRFFGRQWLIRLFAITLVLPVLVGVFGLLAIYGNSGWLARLLDHYSLPLPFSVYGLSGILLAHVFFNLPYASRLLLQALEGIPAEQHKLCAHLGMTHWNKFKWVEWPRLRQQLPHVCGLVFMLCFTSFATVMALGGGPKSTTVELAIYQAIKFDFDLQTGAMLALWQMTLCVFFYLMLQRFSKPLAPGGAAVGAIPGIMRDSWWARIWDGFWIGCAVLFVVPPLLMVVFGGMNGHFLTVIRDSGFWAAVLASLKVACLAAVVALSAGFSILLSSRALRLNRARRRAEGLELAGTLILVTPGLVISTGLFLLLRSVTDAFSYAYWVVAAVNAMMALPYVLKTLAQPMLHIAQQYQILCDSLGMKGWQRLKLVEFRALKKPLSHAFALSFLLSMGDLSAIALFGSQEFRTLPLYLFQLLGSYQMDAAAVVSLALLLFSGVIFYGIEALFSIRSGVKHARR